jgi:hypothetical protein
MDLEAILMIAETGIGIAKQINAGTVVAKDAAIAEQLLKIIQAGKAAYEAHTGEPLDESLIQPEEEV